MMDHTLDVNGSPNNGSRVIAPVMLLTLEHVFVYAFVMKIILMHVIF